MRSVFEPIRVKNSARLPSPTALTTGAIFGRVDVEEVDLLKTPSPANPKAHRT
jgi:hypothetical protein